MEDADDKQSSDANDAVKTGHPGEHKCKEEAAKDTPEAESPEPMECDKVNGDLSSPEQSPAHEEDARDESLVSPSASSSPQGVKGNRQRKQVLSPVNVSDESNPSPTSSKPLSTVSRPQSKKTKLRRILPAANTPELPSPDNVPQGAEGVASGSVSPSLSCTEYAQYLGLQPTVKFKCYKCGEAGFPSITKLKEHQNFCLKSSRSNTPEPNNSNPINPQSQNLRITRKVYLCSSCGTYFENWNLYIHMREVHRRHVCLTCLGMFMHAEKLALHMSSKHNTTLEAFGTANDFLSAHPSSSYLTCCTCEKIFSEQDNFFEHECVEKIGGEKRGCAMCGLQFAHTPNCPHSDTTGHGKGTASEKVSSDAGPSQQQKAEDTPQDRVRRHSSSSSSETTLPEKPSAKAGVKKRPSKTPVYRELDGKLNASSVCEVGMKSPPKNVIPAKLKPSCLRIKLAPVSKRSMNKKIVNKSLTSKHNDSSDKDEEDSPIPDDVDLNEELKMLAEDDSSNPATNLQNGEKSPSISPEPISKPELDTVQPKEPVDTGQPSSEETPRSDEQEKAAETSKMPSALVDGPAESGSSSSDTDDAEGMPPAEPSDEEEEKMEVDEDEAVSEPVTAKPASPQIDQQESDGNESDDEASRERLDSGDNMELPDRKGNSNLDQVDSRERVDSGDITDSRERLDSENMDSIEKLDSENLDHQDSRERLDTESLDSRDRLDSENLGSRDRLDSENLDSRDRLDSENLGSRERLDSENLGSRERLDSENLDQEDLKDENDKMDQDSKEKLDVEKLDQNSDDDDDKDEWHIDERSSKDGMSDNETSVLENGDKSAAPVDQLEEEEEELQLAGEDAPLMDLSVESSLDDTPVQSILKLAIQEASSSCVYCTHATKIAVNGKQLAIHLLSEHRYQLVVNSERLSTEKFVDHVKQKMPELENSFFNCDTYDNSIKERESVFVKSYECFQCRYVTKVHKDLYLHNRKMHQKNSLVCIMCKSNFYSYSELLCHLCPGIYMITNQPLFRCCFCPLDNLPSAFRFMVHVRKRHQACDVCLEVTHNQQKLSNHVWKHKLHHFCYRCGIAYRNKPDITKHLFWKHGTESVLCKRCLQKKWPYVYHFCIPPSLFTCEECNATFSRAVALKVHKRLHSGELLYPCGLCTDSFISRKLLVRHDRTIHNPPPPEENPPEQPEPKLEEKNITINEEIKKSSEASKEQSEEERKAEESSKTVSEPLPEQPSEKKVVDVYDLPPLNLSSESEDESDTEESKKPKQTTGQIASSSDSPSAHEGLKESTSADGKSPQRQENVPQDSVWENFKDYKSSKDSKTTTETPSTSSVIDYYPPPSPTTLRQLVRFDHDYFEPPLPESSTSVPLAVAAEGLPVEEIDVSGEANTSMDHNYCFNNGEKIEKPVEEESITPKKKQKTPKKKRKSGESGSSSSDSDSSSSGSDSSSCSCGTNCSCSSSSSSSSGSSSSDSSDSDSSSSEKRTQKKAKKKSRSRKHDKQESAAVNGHAADAGMSGEEPNVEEGGVDAGPPVLLFHESDLDTDESETDEDFYDEHPRLLMPNRNLLLLSSAVDSLASPQATPAPTPPPPVDPEPLNNGQIAQDESLTNNLPVKQSKSKKRKRSLSNPRRENKLKISIPKIINNETSSTPSTVQKKIKVPKPWISKPIISNIHSPLPSASAMSPAFPTTPSTPLYPDVVYSPSGSDMRGGSGSETDSKRLSKRRRVPKKFYGDSSDEEGLTQAPVVSYVPAPPPVPPPLPPPPIIIRPPKKKIRTSSVTVVSEPEATRFRNPADADSKLQAILDYVAAGFDGRTADHDYKRETPRTQPKLILTIGNHTVQAAPEQPQQSSSSEESAEETDEEEEEPERPAHVVGGSIPPPAMGYLQRPIISNRHDSVKLYCYCQCPYDEVSEMIACDGKNCAIEWFHFECVGITVPPKGKWYCPDCRKRYNIAEPLPNPQYFYNPSSEYMMSSTDPANSYMGT